MRTDEDKLSTFLVLDRKSKFAFTPLHPTANVKTAANFKAAHIKAVPKDGHRAPPITRVDRVCHEHVEHLCTKPNHPWTSGQVERIAQGWDNLALSLRHSFAARRSLGRFPQRLYRRQVASNAMVRIATFP